VRVASDRPLSQRTGALWWYMPIVPALRRLRQEDHEFEASLADPLKKERGLEW
jgi:hypothetical protein